MDTKKAALIGLGCLVVGFVLGYGSGRVSTGTPLNPLSGQKGGYEAGYQAAMQKIAASGILPPSPQAASSLVGTVTAVEDGRLRIEVDTFGLDPLGQKSLPKERTVVVGAETRLAKLVEIAPEEYEAALKAYQEAAAAFTPDPEDPTPPPLPPSAFKETAVAIADIKVGDTVNVTSAEDILAAATIQATSVVIVPLAAAIGADVATPEPEGGEPAPELPTPDADSGRPAAPSAEPRTEAPRI